MRDLINLVEAASPMGFVISYIDHNFEDFELVDWDTQDWIQSGHSRNLFNNTMEQLRNMEIDNAFELFAKFVESKLGPVGKKLGPDYADQDDPGDSYMMYPVDDQRLGDMIDAFKDEIGYE